MKPTTPRLTPAEERVIRAATAEVRAERRWTRSQGPAAYSLLLRARLHMMDAIVALERERAKAKGGAK